MTPKFDSTSFRRLFPFFDSHQETSYLDNAATTQRFGAAVDRMCHFWIHENSNIHRGAYSLSAAASQAFSDARKSVANFLGASDERGVIFVRGTTEAINLVAHSLGEILEPDSTVMLSYLEHHSNIVPWQLLSKRRKIKLVVAEVDDSARLNLESFKSLLLQHKPRLVSLTHIANSTGTINPIKELITLAHEVGALVLVDAAQSVAHKAINVEELNCDFLAFSGHKVYGPTGIGVLYGKPSLLESMPPFHGGGDMINQVSFEDTSFADIPRRFEAGTPAIAEVLGLAVALEMLSINDLNQIEEYEQQLTQYAWQRLSDLGKIKLYGPASAGLHPTLTAAGHASIIAFNVEGAHAHDVATICDSSGVQIRAGHHCAMPLLRRLGIPACARASFAAYNTRADVDRLCSSLERVKKILA